MYILMQISDLHRSEASLISNDELLSSLTADCGRFVDETPPVHPPNAIFVCGDLVRGLPLNSTEYPKVLERQYADAFDLLTRLADTFLGGDRSKVIIVPGNHDVDWNNARNSMKVVGRTDESIQELLATPGSPYRWSWRDQKLYKIEDYKTYEERFGFFCDFYFQFYKGADLAFQVDPKRTWNLFELDDGRILVGAFNSCVNADCFSLYGEIPAQAIAQSHLTATGHYELKIAVWHHDTRGVPRRSDYLDPDIVQLMIDRGYRLGMHGHRHKSDVLPFYLHTTPEMHIMAVVGAGSLSAALTQIPHGFNRQYNIIEISDDYTHARVHIREMVVPSVFSQGRMTELGGRSYSDLQWTATPANAVVNTGRGGGSDIVLVEHMESLISKGRHEDAIAQIDATNESLGHYGRQLLSKALFEAKKWDRLEEHLSCPRNSDELTKLVLASITLKHWTEAEQAISAADKSGRFPALLLKELRDRLSAEKEMSQ